MTSISIGAVSREAERLHAFEEAMDRAERMALHVCRAMPPPAASAAVRAVDSVASGLLAEEAAVSRFAAVVHAVGRMGAMPASSLARASIFEDSISLGDFESYEGIEGIRDDSGRRLYEADLMQKVSASLLDTQMFAKSRELEAMHMEGMALEQRVAEGGKLEMEALNIELLGL